MENLQRAIDAALSKLSEAIERDEHAIAEAYAHIVDRLYTILHAMTHG